ncbi:MAG: Mur ligase family protein [Vampirovibrionales bacterium]|nr:Mur ligase family protein [Vampirovibrionales bacterium]
MQPNEPLNKEPLSALHQVPHAADAASPHNAHETAQPMPARPPQAMRLGLSRMLAVMAALGNPQDAVPSIHIAGTNGKGSVAAMLSHIFNAAGIKTGFLSSPHLVCETERIQLRNTPIPRSELEAILAELHAVEHRLGWTLETERLTYFELMMAAGFLWLARSGAQLQIVETGLGGRLDASNILIKPLCTAITSIGLDHTEILGDTLAKIAAEKAGIFKPGCPVALGPELPAEALAVIMAHAAGVQTGTVSQAGWPAGWQAVACPGGWQIARHVSMAQEATAHEPLFLPLMGAYQLQNLSTVLTILSLMPEHFRVSDAALRQGLASVRWLGRFTPLVQDDAGNPFLVIDGAHNPAGWQAMLAALQLHSPNRPVLWRLSLLKNRDPNALLGALASFDALQLGWFCPDPARFWENPAPTQLATLAWPACFMQDYQQAQSLAQAGSAAELNAPLIVYTGSLYSAGLAFEQLKTV